FVPVAVGDDDVAGTTLFHTRGDGGKHVGQRTGAREVHAGAAAGVVQVIVREAGNHGAAFEVDHRRGGPGELSDVGRSADGGELPSGDGDRLCDREPRVDRDDV